MYADDRSLLCSSKNKHELIGKVHIEQVKINRWLVVNQLIITESKTKFMVFHRNNKQVSTVLHPIYINIASTNREYSFKFLGVVLDISLKFEELFLNFTRNISIFFHLIYRFCEYVNRAVVMLPYSGLIYPNLI